MGKATGFLELDRKDRSYLPPEDRVQNFREFVVPLDDKDLHEQASRCMDCGVPYCHNGCPVNNQIPDWNDLVFTSDWQAALSNLHSTNNFPEFTGRICPAPCEASCTLNIDDNPVTHQVHRVRNCRPRMGKWLDRSRYQHPQNRKINWRCRRRPCRYGSRTTTGTRRS